jgi:hypothetical protein
MKSIAYTLSLLLLGATFAQADAPSAPADKTVEVKAPAKDNASTGKIEVIEEEVEVEDNDSDETKASDKPKAPASK